MAASTSACAAHPALAVSSRSKKDEAMQVSPPQNRQQLLRGTIDVKRGESVLRAHDTIVDFAFLGP